MALKKVKELQDGSSAEYWKITEAIPNKMIEKLVFTIRLFRTKSASDSKMNPTNYFHKLDMDLPANYKSLTVDQMYALGYEKIKLLIAGEVPHKLSGKLMMYNDLYGAEDV